MRYYAGFDLSELTLGTITVNDGSNNAVVNLATGVTGTDQDSVTSTLFFHYMFSDGGTFQVNPENVLGDGTAANAVLRKWANAAYCDRLENALQAAAVLAGFGDAMNLFVSCARTTGLYTITYSGNITVTFSSDAGRLFLGFDDGTHTGAASYTSDYVPQYVLAPTCDGASSPGVGDAMNYEPGGLASQAVSDTGRSSGISRSVSPTYRDWVQQFETKTKTFRLSADTTTATATHPWTFQDLFEHCRTTFPFVVVGGFNESYDEVFRLTAAGSSFVPERASPGNDSQFHLSFNTLVEGIPATVPS